MERLASLLDSGVRVSPDAVVEGVRLWDQYLHGIHLARLELIPAEGPARCGSDVGEILEDHHRSRERTATLRRLAEAYRSGGPRAAADLAAAIRAAAYVDSVWVAFEEEHPFACLAQELTGDQRRSLDTQFRESGSRLAALEEEVQRFLAEPVGLGPTSLSVRCSAAGCDARGDWSLLASSATEMRLGALPAGWSVGPGPAVSTGGVGPIALYCPAHAARTA